MTSLKNMTMQIMMTLPQILVWPVKTKQRVSVPNLKLSGLIKTEFRAKEVGQFSIM